MTAAAGVAGVAGTVVVVVVVVMGPAVVVVAVAAAGATVVATSSSWSLVFLTRLYTPRGILACGCSNQVSFWSRSVLARHSRGGTRRSGSRGARGGAAAHSLRLRIVFRCGGGSPIRLSGTKSPIEGLKARNEMTTSGRRSQCRYDPLSIARLEDGVLLGSLVFTSQSHTGANF